MEIQHIMIIYNQTKSLKYRENHFRATYEEVRLVEVVGDVPANLAVLASLLHHSMEEGQHIYQTAVGRVRACKQGLLGYFRVRCSYVQLETVGRLCHYLHTILKHM